MTAEEFLSDLARQNLVPGDIIESLRRQVAKSARPVAPQTLVKLLVDKGHLTAVQGQKLLGAAPAKAAPAAPTPAKKPAPAALEPLGLADDMGLAPLDDLLAPLPAQPAAAPTKPAAAPAKSATKQAAPAKQSTAAPAKPAAPAAKAKAPAPLEDLQPLDGLEPLGEVMPLDDVMPLGDAAPLDMSSGGDLFGVSAGGLGTATADPFAPAAKSTAAAVADPFAHAAAPATPATVPAAATAPAKPAKKSSGIVGLVIGLVLVLVIAGGTAAAFFLIPRETGEKDFAAAEADYQAKQYPAAIEKYDAALLRYPHSPQAGLAKVHLAQAKLLTASSSKTDWPALLTVAKEVLPPIAGQPELSQVHAELAPLLTDMADGLATLAAKGKTAEEITTRVAHARDALALTGDARLVPGSLRQWQRLASAEESLAIVEYNAARTAALDAAVAKIKASAGSGKTDAAYVERSQLLAAYPDLAASPPLRDALQEVAQAEADRALPIAEKPAAETTEAQPAIVASLAFAAPIAATPAAAPGRKFVAAASGSVWAFDGPTGKLLWRRPARGSDLAGPVPLSADNAGDWLVADGNQLLRVASATGALVWRQSFDSPLAGSPVVSGANVLATTRSGRVVKLDAVTGSVAVAVQLPQPCRVSPAVAASGSHVYQLADHSHLYALSAADLTCAGVVYIGHESASVVTPPLAIGQHLLVADNAGAADAVLQVVGLKDDGLPQGVVQRVDLPGNVLSPPVVLGNHVIVVTDRGTNVALAVSSERSTPLEQLNNASAGTDQIAVRYGLPLGEKLVLAGDGLRLEALDASSGNFQPTWTAFAGDSLLGPPQQAGDVLFCLRRDVGGKGVIGSAIQASTGKPLWQTRVAVPLAGGPLMGDAGETVMAVTQLGFGDWVDPGVDPNGPVYQFAPLPADRVALPQIGSVMWPFSSEHVLIPAGRSSRLFRMMSKNTADAIPLNLPGALACHPALWNQGLLVVCSTGDVQLIDPKSGAQQAEAIQIPVRRAAPENCSLALVGDNGELAVFGDGDTTLRLISLDKNSPPRLVENVSIKTPSTMISPVSALGSHVFVTLKGGALQAFALPELAAGPSFKLDSGSVVYGPENIGTRLLVATERDDLLCFDAQPKQVWKVPLAHGALAGSPLEDGETIVLATKTGSLVRLAASSGKELAHLDLGQTLAGTPEIVGQFVLVPTADGTLLKVALPQEGTASP